MKRFMDDIESWRLQQENISNPFPYVFPQMPPRFRWCRCFTQALFVVQWGTVLVQCLGFILIIPLAFFLSADVLRVMADLLFLLMPLSFLARWLRHTARFFWRCPCCGQPFPYYAPDGKHEEMREKDCYATLQQMRIGYVKTKPCPLVIPSICPGCKRKFFEMVEGPTKDK